MEKTRFFSARNIAYLAVLLALAVVLQLYAGAIPVGPAEGGASLNFALVPIVLAALLLGWAGGAFVGFTCGVVVLFQVILTPSNPFYLAIWTNSPVVTVFTCLVKTTVAGLVAGLLYSLIAKKNRIVAVFVASAAVPILNTGLFIIGCLCMTGTIAELGSVAGLDILIFILVGIVSFNFFIELAINLVLAPVIDRVVKEAEKRLSRKKASPVVADDAENGKSPVVNAPVRPSDGKEKL